jgi:hypothetical protein
MVEDVSRNDKCHQTWHTVFGIKFRLRQIAKNYSTPTPQYNAIRIGTKNEDVPKNILDALCSIQYMLYDASWVCWSGR